LKLMRVAALYDIHGNLPALEAVLDDVRRQGIEQIVVGGDVFPGPMSIEALELLLAQDVAVRFLRGNGDRVVLDLAEGRETDPVPASHRAPLEWVAQQLRPEHRRILQSWPATIRFAVDGIGEVLFCHASPRNDTDIFTRLTSEHRLRPLFADVGADLVVCGHTHMQFDRTVGDVRVVNAGSIGMPFGEPGAYWLLLGRAIELRCTEYDRVTAARRVRATARPGAEAFAAQFILQPPAEQQMLDAFRASEHTLERTGR
jgi:putative phosphoesterase